MWCSFSLETQLHAPCASLCPAEQEKQSKKRKNNSDDRSDNKRHKKITNSNDVTNGIVEQQSHLLVPSDPIVQMAILDVDIQHIEKNSLDSDIIKLQQQLNANKKEHELNIININTANKNEKDKLQQ